MFVVKMEILTHSFRRQIRLRFVLKKVVGRHFSSFNTFLFSISGDVKLGVIDTVSVRLNLVGKRVQVDEEAENFHRETSRKSGIVQVQGAFVFS